MLPLVSIHLPVYNGARYLPQAIESHLAQTFGDFELLISDNHSTDATPDICREFAGRDPRVHYFCHAENRGVIVNSNWAYSQTRGRYFRWASHDDFLGADHLLRCVETLEAHADAVVAYTRVHLVDSNGEPLGEYQEGLDLRSPTPRERFRECLANQRLCNVPFGLIRSHVLRRTGLFAPYCGSDLDLVLELSLHGKFIEIPEPLFFRRIHDLAVGSSKGETELQHHAPGPHIPLSYRLSRLNQFVNRVAGACRSPISYADRMRIIGLILRHGYWQRRDLLQELMDECVRCARGMVRPTNRSWTVVARGKDVSHPRA